MARGIVRYKSYNFRDKDPAIDELRTAIEADAGARLTRKMLREVEIAGGPKAQTMVGWFFKDTKRPINATLEAAGRAAGFRRQWVKMNGNGKGHK